MCSVRPDDPAKKTDRHGWWRPCFSPRQAIRGLKTATILSEADAAVGSMSPGDQRKRCVSQTEFVFAFHFFQS